MFSRSFLFLFFWGVALANALAPKLSLDFVNTDIKEVVRTISAAYDMAILVDQNISANITVHLDSVGLFEGLSAIASANGLEVIQEGALYRIRKKIERGENRFYSKDGLVFIDVQNKEIQEFIKEYAANTNLNILIDPKIKVKISGRLQGLPAHSALVSLMKAHGFRVRSGPDCFFVEEEKQPKEESSSIVELAYRDSLFFVDLEAASLKNVLNEMATLAHLNLAVYGELRENVYLKADSLPLNALLKMLFQGSRYTYTFDSLGTILVGERGAPSAIAANSLYYLEHIHSEKALLLLTKAYQDRGLRILEVKEQNALLLMGASTEIESASHFLKKIDVETLQVLLECIIVEFNKGKQFEFGFRSGSAKKTSEGGLGINSFIRISDKSRFWGRGFGEIGLLSDQFDFELAALEENNQAEILARPSISTLNGNKASINVTNTTYYMVSQVSADGFPITDYRSFNEGVSLEITPSVARSGEITIEIIPEIKTSARSSGEGPRDISTRNLKTTVSLKEGETFCLGGLIRKTSAKVRSAIPFLGSLPWVGKWFSYHTNEDYTMELAVFITPRLIRKNKSKAVK